MYAALVNQNKRVLGLLEFKCKRLLLVLNFERKKLHDRCDYIFEEEERFQTNVQLASQYLMNVHILLKTGLHEAERFATNLE